MARKLTNNEQAVYIETNLNRWKAGPQGRRALFDEIHGYRRSPILHTTTEQSVLNVRRAKRFVEAGRLSNSMRALTSCGVKPLGFRNYSLYCISFD